MKDTCYSKINNATYRHSFSTDGVDMGPNAGVVPFLGGVSPSSSDRSGLLISIVDAAPRESTLGVLEMVEARRLPRFSLEETDVLEMVEARRLMWPCLGLPSDSSFSILVWRDRTCRRAVSERLLRSRSLCTGTISPPYPYCTEPCEPA